MKKIRQFFQKRKVQEPDWKQLSQIEGMNRLQKMTLLVNRHPIVFHIILAMLLCLAVETVSRFSLIAAFSFVFMHTGAFIYNSIIIFASLSIVFLCRRRLLARLLIGSFWVFLGTINGCVLQKRVTPFCFTDIQCISDLFAMKNTKYFTATEATIVVISVIAFLIFCVFLFVKGPKFQGHMNKMASLGIVVVVFACLPFITDAARGTNIVAGYFSNIAQGYRENGFVYGFSSSVLGIGMSKPEGYSEEKVQEYMTEGVGVSSAAILASTEKEVETTAASLVRPNIVLVLLESFVDPDEVNFLECSEDPVPNFHKLYNNYSSGHLTVPVIGAGTSNTEFEVLTDMSMEYFGTGEYPHKTILKKTDCESIASDLDKLGYGTHVVHNNGGNFYSRANAFSMMGFDSFSCKETMNIQEYTPLNTWATDHILVNETKKAMDATVDQADFVYTITVEAHGDYPEEKVVTNPAILVSGAEDEGSNNAWEYYINQIHKVDQFIGDLTQMLEKRGEPTMVVMFGDHLPTMDLEEKDMKTGSLFQTKYITWNNYGLPKKDADLTAYQLMAEITDQVGIHTGTMFTFTQNQKNNADYHSGLEMLQYDLLYGKRYAYSGNDLYPASDIMMGIDEISIDVVNVLDDSDTVYIHGKNFTPWTKIYINGEKVSTDFESPYLLTIKKSELEDYDVVVANICGSSDTIFRSSNQYIYMSK